jgi:ParB family transcriptional regulator, chromosome partitioning protein
MPPKGRLQVGSNIGIDKDKAFRDKIAELEKSQVKEISLLLIDEVQNVRKVYDEEGIKQLAASIEKHGLLQPVLLNENGTRYSIQAGHRRVRAFQALNRETIPAIVRPSPEYLAEVQLIENIQREDLSPADLELAVKALVQRSGSQEKVALLLMKSKQWVSNILAAAKVRDTVAPALEELGMQRTLPSGHLREIASVPPQEQPSVVEEAIHDGGGKRAFRAAAAKAKKPQGDTESASTSKVLFSLTARAERLQDGSISLKTEQNGEVPPEVRLQFKGFCAKLRETLNAE